jgi:hypothetical protein
MPRPALSRTSEINDKNTSMNSVPHATTCDVNISSREFYSLL